MCHFPRFFTSFLPDLLYLIAMQRTKWVDRKFTFDFPEGWIYNIMERLQGTPARIKELVANLDEDHANQKPGGKWSIKEHIGHLYDLEFLHDGRLDDFIEGKEILRAADMKNVLTEESNHNLSSLEQLQEKFNHSRRDFLTKLASLDDATLMRKALHPRLQILMRPVDVAYFCAEHDDHHLASIRAIVEGRPSMDE